jgi:murein DD-endopeptidase MepM/ murein hydrolase activator NlpD
MRARLLDVFIISLVTFNAALAAPSKRLTAPTPLCKVGSSADCSSGQVCMNTPGGPKCLALPPTAPLTDLILPFDSATEAICTHASGIGSHSWPNAFYALDLATPYEQPAATIRAAADGKAFVFLGEDGKPCPEPPGTPAQAVPDTCGDSWGNHIKILHTGGYYSFYVHLDQVLIKNGDPVKQGQPIGIEGWTGAAGHRHLHWSIQKLPGATQADWESKISWAGDSVPFNFCAVLDGRDQIVSSPGLQCAHASIGQASYQPRLRGVK